MAKESLVSGSGELVWDARAVVKKYVGSLKGFWFDVYVIFPVPQVTCINFFFFVFENLNLDFSWYKFYILIYFGAIPIRYRIFFKFI